MGVGSVGSKLRTSSSPSLNSSSSAALALLPYFLLLLPVAGTAGYRGVEEGTAPGITTARLAILLTDLIAPSISKLDVR